MLAQLTARYHDDRATEGRSYRLTVLAHPALEDPAPAGTQAIDTPQAQADGGGDDA